MVEGVTAKKHPLGDKTILFGFGPTRSCVSSFLKADYFFFYYLLTYLAIYIYLTCMHVSPTFFSHPPVSVQLTILKIIYA